MKPPSDPDAESVPSIFGASNRAGTQTKGGRMRGAVILSAVSAALAVTVVAPASASAQAAPFYEGKTVTLVVGYSPAGGYDNYARMLARHIGRHIPGNPNVIVQNMPGAATLTAVRYLGASAPRDGTVITMFDPGLITESLAMPETMKIKFSDYRWIGNMLRDIRVCYAWAATGIKNWQDAMARRQFLIGTTAKGSQAYVNGAILRKIFNAPVRQIAGYPGSAEQRLALERGELEGNCASWSSIPQDWLAEHKINPLVRFSPKRPPDMPADVPYIVDLARTQEEKDILTILAAPGELGRPLIAAKSVPPERVRILRAAFEAALRDAAFLADAQKQSLPIDPVTGEEAEAIIATIYAAPPDLAKKVRNVLE
jgi:tripartite-type tricarboxylate transporter receptor subunit TctC